MPAPMRPPTLIVASDRNVARSTEVPRSASVTAPNCAAPVEGALGSRPPRGWATNRSRTQRRPKTSKMIAPTISAGMLTTSPTRMQATPIAKPMGWEAGRRNAAWPGCSSLTRRLRASALDSTLPPCSVSTPNPPALPARLAAAILHGSVVGGRGQPELGPAGVDAPLHVGTSSRPRAATRARPRRAPSSSRRSRSCRRTTGAPTRGRAGRSGRPRGRRRASDRRSRRRAEEDVLVVADVDVLVDHDHGLREREEAESPHRVHHLPCACVPCTACGSTGSRSRGTRPRSGGRSRRARTLIRIAGRKIRSVAFGVPLVLRGRLADDNRRADRPRRIVIAEMRKS